MADDFGAAPESGLGPDLRRDERGVGVVEGSAEPRSGDASYRAFLEAKVRMAAASGLEVPTSAFRARTLGTPHVVTGAQWAARGGRRALFWAFGLHKTAAQLELMRVIRERVEGLSLIVCPLGVRDEFVQEAAELDAPVHWIRRTDEARPGCTNLTNYEAVREGNVDPRVFRHASLDEASVLRSYGSKTFQSFLPLFAETPFRFVATATPSPNRYKELIHYAGYLGVMDTGQALTRFFQRNPKKAGDLTLYPHKEEEFWLWCASWGLFVQRPSDLGYSDAGYEMPPLVVRWHEVGASASAMPDVDRDGQASLLPDRAMGMVDAAREKRESLPARMAKAVELVEARPDDHVIIWHDLEDERGELERRLPDLQTVYGTQDPDDREQAIRMFQRGWLTRLGSKPVLMGSGCNLQAHCHWEIFSGIGFKFNDFIQAIYRVCRFGQRQQVEIDIIHTEAEREVRRELEAKWARDTELRERMSAIIRRYGLNELAMAETLRRSIGVERVEVASPNGRWRVALNDCVDEASRLAEASLDLVVTSVPFSNHYEYTPSYCFDAETEVLTRRGWIGFDELDTLDDVATVNPTTLELEWQMPRRVVWEPYRGPMLRFKNRANFDLLVTPNHKMFVDRRVGNRKSGRTVAAYGFATAQELTDRFVMRGDRLINCPKPGDGQRPATIEVPPAPRGARGPARLEIGEIATADMMQLIGWYLSEGYCDALAGAHGGRITIAQSAVNEPFRQEIAAMFERIGLGVQRQEKAIVANNRSIAAWLLENFGGGSHHKFIPPWLFDLHPELLTILRDTMMKGDGNKTGFAYTSFSRRLRDDFQTLCLFTGWRATIRGTVVGIGKRQRFPEIRRAPERVDYEGMIGCATVANGTLVVRRNGVPCVTGNSDFGHTESNDHFWAQMDFLTPQLMRALKPGRLACVHVKDRILFGKVTGEGVPTVSPFHAEAIFHYIRHGFQYLGMHDLQTDVVSENAQSYRLGYTEMCKDSSKMGCGSPEYVLLVRKPQTDKGKSYGDVRIVKAKADYSLARWQVDAAAFWRSSGDRLLTPDEWAALAGQEDGLSKVKALWKAHCLSGRPYDYAYHVKVGEAVMMTGKLPASWSLLDAQSRDDRVWTDVDRLHSLNGAQASAGREKHVCPLPFDIVERLIVRYSEPGELVYDPFGGLGTVPYCAVKLGRRGASSELHEAYFRDSIAYLRALEENATPPPGLFDALDAMEAAA